MNQLALAYGIAGLSAAIAIAVVVGTYGGPDVDPTPAVHADRGDSLVADRRRERPRRAQAAAAAAAETPPAEVQAPPGVQYVDEQGNPVPPPSARSASRRGEEGEEEEGEEHEEHERREHRFEREEGDDD